MTTGNAAWREIPDGSGTQLAVTGSVVAAADGGWLRVWRDGVRVLEIGASSYSPGRPVIVGDRVLWGPHEVDLASGLVTVLAGLEPPDGYLATAYSWTADGSVGVGAGQRLGGAHGSLASATAWLYDAGDGGRRLLWEGLEPAPVAVAAGHGVVVLGLRQPAVSDLGGRLRASLPSLTAPLRVEVAAVDQSPIVLAVEAGRLAVYATGGLLVGERAGVFLDGTLAPWGDGVVLAVDLDGALTAYAVGPGLPELRRWSLGDPVSAVAADAATVLAAFRVPPGLRLTDR